MTSVYNVLEKGVLPFISPALLQPGYFAPMQPFLEKVPWAGVHALHFEVRLQEEAPTLDFLFDFTNHPKAKQELLDLAGRHNAAHAVWPRLQALGQAWAVPESFLSQHLRNIWLEFDWHQALHPAPSFFFGPFLAHDPATKAQVLQEGLQHTGYPLPQSWAKVQEALSLFPGNQAAGLYHMGLMLGRDQHPADTARLCIQAERPAQIIEALQTLAWPGDSKQLASILEQLAPMANIWSLDIDVQAGQVQTPIGIEVLQRSTPLAPNTNENIVRQTIQLMHFLESTCGCLPAKVKGITNFVGFTPNRRTPDGQVETAYLRRLDHVKFNIHQGDIVQAKAYLALEERNNPALANTKTHTHP